MRYCIDALNYNGIYFTCTGWIAPEYQGDRVELTVYDASGKEIPIAFTRFLRSDVLIAMYKKDGNERYGFTFEYRAEKYEDAVMEIRSLDHAIDHIRVHLRFREQEAAYYRQHTAWGTLKRFLRSANKKDFFTNERFSVLLGDNHDYAVWFEKNKPDAQTLKKERKTVFPLAPLVSILVPVYKPDPVQFSAMLSSVKAQSYRNFELILANGSPEQSEIAAAVQKIGKKDPRFRLITLQENGGISENTNEAFKASTGSYIALLDQDDLLTPDALFEMVKALNGTPEARILYSDEDKLEDETGFFKDPYFKPDFSPALLYTSNYICHFLMVHREVYQAAGGLRKAFDGAQDFDFVLRITENQTAPIVHVPRILYHWRIHARSTAGNMAEKSGARSIGQQALSEAFSRLGLSAKITDTELPGRYHAAVDLPNEPLVSVLIPNKDHIEDLNQAVDSLLTVSDYENIEILIIENNSEEPETFEAYRQLEARDKRIRVLYYDGGFNYSAINNFGEKEARGEYLLLLNNDTEVIAPDFLRSMLGHMLMHKTAVVGAKLLYEDQTIQHAGVLCLTEGAAHHLYLYASKDEIGYMGRLILPCNVSAVTAACMLIRRSVYEDLGGLDPAFSVAYNDVDLCLRVLDAGYEIVYDPDALLYHDESKSRGYDGSSKEKQARLQEESKLLYARHEARVDKDPYYHPAFSMQRGYYKLP